MAAAGGVCQGQGGVAGSSVVILVEHVSHGAALEGGKRPAVAVVTVRGCGGVDESGGVLLFVCSRE